MEKAYMNKEYTFYNKEEGKEQIDFQKVLEKREEPLKNISAYYDEQRKLEAEAIKKAESDELAKLPPKPLTTDEQIQALTEAVASLTKQLNEKGDK